MAIPVEEPPYKMPNVARVLRPIGHPEHSKWLLLLLCVFGFLKVFFYSYLYVMLLTDVRVRTMYVCV